MQLDLYPKNEREANCKTKKGGCNNMKGKWAVKVSENWRIVFDFKEGDAYNVDYIDYH